MAAKTCYKYGGAQDNSAAIQPCPDLLGTPMCCWLDRSTSDMSENDICTPQGLCVSATMGSNQLSIDSCTDRNWGSGCSPLTGVCGARDAYLIVTQCEDGSFCCGEKNDTCCAPRTGLYLSRDGRTVLPNPNLSSTTYVCSTINLKVGFGISVGLLGLGLCALGVFAVLQRRKIVVHGPKKEASVAHEGTIRGAGVEPAKDGAIPYEMAAREYIRELQ